ncbi:hypothetical protein SAMN03159463_04058 [Mesorhizobium sp. NFR06]|uniref:hypothetical protein n=1 Tax=Mesorhizobium sp. NFR06 TaxID=1566290 RepID=UPI0008F3C74E|nr:hypothetical protein [Mesorhizobium sp. NFR06]SFP35028.1 hypothetical protein SAMN03159463_04058 [Mesorhizobium sp. NFR06]
MPRYATIITGDDGAEIVSAIGEFEGAGLPHGSGRIEQVAPGVRIGMVRGGTVDAVARFGFPHQGLDHSAIAAASAMLKAAPALELPISPQMVEMSGPPSAAAAQLLRRKGRTEGGAVPPALAIGETASSPFDQALPKPARAKPRRKPARKVRKAAKAVPSNAVAHG